LWLLLVGEDLLKHFATPGSDRRQDPDRAEQPPHRRRPVRTARPAAPEWRSESDLDGVIKVAMSGSISNPSELQPYICTKAQRKVIEKRYMYLA